MRLRLKSVMAGLAVLCTVFSPSGRLYAANHREAPITALDHKADITDWYAFVSPENPSKAVMILNVDPFLEPGNGPTYFPFDPGILYEMKVDNNHDGKDDVIFQFRFKTEQRLPGVFTVYVGGLAGIPPITALDGPGSEGLGQRQSYTVTMVTKNGTTDLGSGQTLYAVPTNVGTRTMMNYNGLRTQGTYTLAQGVRAFAGTVADPFYIDLGATFDSLNFRIGGGVLPAGIDGDDNTNYAPDTLKGFNVNSIALEVPITLLTRDGALHGAGDKDAVIGTYGATSRQKVTVLRGGDNTNYAGPWMQVQRMGNPLINELIIGVGSKDRFSMDEPENDAQFANFFLNPLLGTLLGGPAAPRVDLLPLVQYMAPICPGCGPGDVGPIADLLRLNTGIPQTPAAMQKRMAVLAGDFGGFPNGRRPIDDAVDIAARVVGGILVNPSTPKFGDGVNKPSAPLPSTFPFVAPSWDGRDHTH